MACRELGIQLHNKVDFLAMELSEHRNEMPLHDRYKALLSATKEMRVRNEYLEKRELEMQAEARRFYHADGSFEECATAQEVVERRKACAKLIAELEDQLNGGPKIVPRVKTSGDGIHVCRHEAPELMGGPESSEAENVT